VRLALSFAAVLLFTTPARAESLDFAMGKALFDRPWVTAPTATRADDGLGPLFVARSCLACHPGAGRGGLPPETGAALRLADDPVYGRQLQTSAVAGQPAEGRLVLREEKQPFRYPDGGKAELRRLIPTVAEPGFGPVTAPASLRLAPPLFGLGLLEQAGARFGWKGDQPDLAHQTAGAFRLDIGMSTPIYPEHWGDCTPAQNECRAGPHGDSPEFEGLEIPSQMLDLIVVYLRGLPPPDAPKPDRKGDKLFAQTGCAACHSPTLSLQDRFIAPYSDLRLHDMGPGLADEVPGAAATGSDWRTPPLWGLRDAPKDPQGRLNLLHDGRARSVEEAVLWHGGAAEDAKRRFVNLPAERRRALLRFVGSL
jgi:CxxC motif-containing protein (DUF1111 family)